MGGKTLHLACACGEVRGRLVDVDARSGTHIKCHCNDCRASLKALGQSDPGDAGVEIFQTTPDHVRIDQGGENLHILRLSPNGLLRWYAKCCNTPLFNTVKSPRVAMVGVIADRVAETEDLGPLKAEAYIKTANGKMHHKGAYRMVGGVALRAGKALVSGTWRDTPFFDDAGTPTAPQRVLTRAERVAALTSG